MTVTSREQQLTKDEQNQNLLNEAFIKAFFRLLRTVKIHKENNQSIIRCAEEFTCLINKQKTDKNNIILRFKDKRIYLQDEKLLYLRKNINLYDTVYEYFKKREIGGFNFNISQNMIPLKQLMAFARMLNSSKQHNNPLKWLEESIEKNKISSWVNILDNFEKKPETNSRKEQGRKNYSYVMASVKEISQKLSTQNQAGIHKTLRVTQNMVDLMMEDEPLFKALSTIRIYDDYTFSHSVNVAILAMCIGKRINLSKKSLERLGLCGLLHDLGKVEVSKEILNKPAKLTDEEFEEMKKHTLYGVRLIVKIRASRDRKAKLLLPPFEHHLKYDLSGYPQSDRRAALNLFSRILCIADVYDAITSPRVYRRSVLSPAQALGLMFKGFGTDFDPILFKIFINMMGVYPVGTLLQLDNDEMGLVIDASDGADGNMPKVVLLLPDGKGGYNKGEQKDLSEKNPVTGKYLKNIVRSYHPSVFNIQPFDFLI